MARFDRTIPPGGEGTITLRIKTYGLPGDIHKTARVFTNDPKNPELTIGLKGKVWDPIHVKPKNAFLTGILGEKVEEVVLIKGEKKEPLVVELALVSIPDRVEVILTEIEKGRTWELRVKNKVEKKARYKGQVKLTTNYPEQDEIVIWILGNLRPLVEVKPRALSFGRMPEEQLRQLNETGEPLRRPVTVLLNKGHDLKINNAELEKSLFEVAAIVEMRAGRMVQLQVEALSEKLKKGENVDRLKIFTNQKNHEVLEIPIRLEIL